MAKKRKGNKDDSKGQKKKKTENDCSKNDQIMIEEIFERFPTLSEGIFGRLDDRSLASCRRVSKAWKECVDFQRIYWIRKILKYAQNFKALYRHFWNYDGIFNTDVKTVSEHKSTIGLKTVEYSPDSPDSHEESFDNDINNNINSQTQDETHDGIGQNKNSFWHKQG